MDLLAYIAAARKKHLDDATIQDNLIATGWNPERVKAALKAKLDDDLPIPLPPRAEEASGFVGGKNGPIAVVHNLSNRGFEYFIMLISLGISAISLGVLLHWLIDMGAASNSSEASDVPTFTVAALIITLPIFALMTIRLRRAEKNQPELLQDPSRKRALQITLIVAFLVGVGHLIFYLATLFEGGDNANSGYYYDEEAYSAATRVISESLESFLHMLATVTIAGTIFAYYWRQLQDAKPEKGKNPLLTAKKS